ncbi:MAG: GC-type dockerin domain-anchored protein [Planctomycetota bacterium]
MKPTAIHAALFGLTIASGATAQTFTWANAVSGNWNVDGNWDLTGFPNVFGESAVIDLPGTYTVTLSTAVIRRLDLLDLGNPDTTLVVNPGSTIIFDALNNDGVFRLNPTGFSSNGVMSANATTTITGAGAIELVGGSNDAQLNTTTTGVVLTNGASHTIRGSGQLNADLVNNGLVQASNTGLGNILEIENNDKINNATFASSSNAVLQFEGVTIDQSGGGLIDAADGSVIFAAGTNTTILGGTIAATAGGTVTRQSGTLSLDNTIIDTDLTVDPGGTIRSLGDLFVNNATLTLNPTGFSSNGILRFDVDALVTGPGVVLLSGGENDAQLNTEPGITVTQDNSHTIRGAGELNAALINNGTVEAANTGLGNVLEIQGQDKTNSGTFASGTSAVLQIEGINLTQGTGGVIDARDGDVNLTNVNTIDGGRINASLGGDVTRQTGTTTLVDTTINADIDIVPGGTIVLEGASTTNNGVMTVNLTGFSSNGVIDIPGVHSLNGTGEILLGGGTNDSQINTNADNNAVLTHAATHTIRGSGTINARIDNFGNIRAENTGLGNVLQLNEQTITNIGPAAEIRSGANAVLEIRDITIEDGVIDTDSGAVQFASGEASTIVGATLNDTNGGIYTRFPGTTTLAGVTSNVTIDVQPGGTIAVGGDGLTNNGTILVNNTGFSTNSLVHFATSTLLDGTGTIDLGGGINDAQITVAESETGGIGSGQTITGSGDMTGAFIFGGTLSPDGGATSGSVIGRIDARGAGIELTTDATLAFDVSSGVVFDQINRPSNDAPVHLAGDLTVNVDPTGNYVLGQELDIIEQGGAITGNFDSNNVASVFINDDVALRLVRRSDEVVLRVINFDCLADFQAPLDVLDLTDVDDFIAAFTSGDPIADIAAPAGIIDLSDVDLFIQLFLSGCL